MWIFHWRRTDLPDGEDASIVALHIQCPWRISNAAQVLCGSEDFYRRTDTVDPDDLQWDPNLGGSDLLRRLKELLQDQSPGLKVSNDTSNWICIGVSQFEHGSLEVKLNNGCKLTAFPASAEAEAWRLFTVREPKHTVWPPESESGDPALL
jgi:hypothetical protein